MASQDEDAKDRRENKFAGAVAEIARSQMGYYIGFGFFMLAIGAGMRWDGHLYNPKGCVEVQVINQKYFKVDSCTGDVEEINVTQSKDVGSKASEENDKISKFFTIGEGPNK